MNSSWTLLTPEIGLVALMLTTLFLNLFTKLKPLASIRVAIIGSVLILGILIFLWPLSGQALHGAFELNSFSVLLKGIFIGAGIVTLLVVREFLGTLEEHTSDFVLLLLTSLLGAFFLASASDLITLFITIEWITISLYVLTAYLKTDEYALEAGTKYLIMGAFSGALFLFGISLIYGAIGSFRFEQIREGLASVQGTPLFVIGLLLVLSGIGFKIASVPFQLWAPDVYQGAPTPVTVFLATVSKTAGFAALLKILFVMLDPNQIKWSFVISLISALTLLYGNLGALGQTNVKRLFAYSSIGHAGYLLMGIAAGAPSGVEATLFYLIAYVLSTGMAFLVIVIANRELGSGELPAYRGLAKKNPFLAGAFFIALLSLGGIPPLAGFFAKFLILQALILKGYLWLAVLGAINVIISLYYYLSIVKEMYFKQGGEGKVVVGTVAHIWLILLAIGTIGIGVFQEPILLLVKSSASFLF